MTEYVTIRIPVALAGFIDDLVKSEQYSSRAEYTKEVIRNDLRERGLLEIEKEEDVS